MAAKFNRVVPCAAGRQGKMSNKKRGRKAASSAEKPFSVYEAIHDDKRMIGTSRRGGAVGKDMKKDLFKLIGLVKTT